RVDEAIEYARRGDDVDARLRVADYRACEVLERCVVIELALMQRHDGAETRVGNHHQLESRLLDPADRLSRSRRSLSMPRNRPRLLLGNAEQITAGIPRSAAAAGSLPPSVRTAQPANVVSSRSPRFPSPRR